jgi:DNA-binding transcriptional MerR regulator
MTQTHFLLQEVSRQVGVKAYQISYALANGYLKEPSSERINNKRIFTREDIARIKTYFESRRKRGSRHEANH